MHSSEFTISIETNSEAETIDVARRVASLLRAGDVVALFGDLGAGKTRFVRGLADGLGIDSSDVASPTFVLLHEYTSADECGSPLVHVDAYRLNSVDELESIGFDELVQARDSIIAVEWAERIADALPEDRIDIEIDHGDGDCRSIRIRPRGATVHGRIWDSLQRSEDLSKGPSKTSKCAICGTPISTDSEFFPFCSSRCRMVDLGRWLGGNYAVSREIRQDDEGI